MELNTSKCHAMRFYRTNNLLLYDYSINTSLLSSQTVIKDLGIWLDTSLTFHEHFKTIINKSLRLLGYIKRVTSDFTSIQPLKILYCSLVRSHLEYCSSVWSPYYQLYSDKIENVQHKFLRHVAFKLGQYMHYDDILQMLNITTLKSRRLHHDLILLFKLVNSQIDCPDMLAKINFAVPNRQTRQLVSFSVPMHRTNYAHYSFLSRSQRIANQFQELDFSYSLNIFKAVLSNIT
uniref:Uncharacterized protein LOC114331715 n=1 Tax=Diabrotica virgifera virgifera TaxID=50390 RepID=A0A6P7FX35_DIAVI